MTLDDQEISFYSMKAKKKSKLIKKYGNFVQILGDSGFYFQETAKELGDARKYLELYYKKNDNLSENTFGKIYSIINFFCINTKYLKSDDTFITNKYYKIYKGSELFKDNEKFKKYLFFIKNPEVDNKFVINPNTVFHSKFILNKNTTQKCYKNNCNFKNYFVSIDSNCSRYFPEKNILVTLCYNHIKQKYGIAMRRKYNADSDKNKIEFTVTNLKERKANENNTFICFFNTDSNYNDIGNYIPIASGDNAANCEIKLTNKGCHGVFFNENILNRDEELFLQMPDAKDIKKKIKQQQKYRYGKFKKNAPPNRLTIGEARLN